MNATSIDPALVPERTLHTGARMPAIGLGTFGTDHVTADEIAAAVQGAAVVGYRHFDCASVYGNEDRIGFVLQKIIAGGIPREELWITSKLWNDKHAEADVIPSCRQSLADLRLDYLDMYLVHWPFPNFHPPGCDVSSRSPDARPYIHANFMKTWRQLEKLVDLGLVRHIGTSNMTIPKLKLLLADARIKPAVNEMELHPHFQQPELFEFVRANGIQPIGYCPIGSPGRPERDRTPDDTVDIEDPVIVSIARRLGVHPAVVCVKWAVQRGANAHPVLRQSAQLPGEPAGRGQPAAHRRRHGSHRRHRQELPPHQRPGVFVERGPDLGRSLGPRRSDQTMTGAFLPGNSTVELKEVPVPAPGHGEVLLRMKASTICGSDIRCIYHEHLGKGPEGYQGVVAGHEPSGQIVKAGPGCRRFGVGDRVIVYHISGCGVCNDCRRGYMISCTSEKYRRAYGWQRDGGMAEFLLAEEKDLIHLPAELTYADGAQVACGFGTVYEGLEKIGISGNHAVLITGLGPVGLATGALCRKLGAATDHRHRRRPRAHATGARPRAVRRSAAQRPRQRRRSPPPHRRHGRGARRRLLRQRSPPAPPPSAPPASGAASSSSAKAAASSSIPRPTSSTIRRPSTDRWVTSTWLMEELVERLVRWNLHPADLVTHRFALDKVDQAYTLMASGKCGKVAVCFDEEL